jgi:hypothetical protein
MRSAELPEVDPDGWPVYADFIDLYGSHIRVQFSSRAFHPACWVWIKAARPDSGGVRSHGSGHLTLPQVIQLRDALNGFIDVAEEQIANGRYWPEPDDEEDA